MSLASQLWSTRSKQTGDDQNTATVSKGVIARILSRGGAAAAETPVVRPEAHTLLFDSMAAKKERSEFHDNDTLTAATAAPLRWAARIVPKDPNSTLMDTKGKRHPCRIINFSATGVAVEARFAALAPELITHVGSLRVKAGRRMRNGMVFIFEKPIVSDRLGPSTVL